MLARSDRHLLTCLYVSMYNNLFKWYILVVGCDQRGHHGNGIKSNDKMSRETELVGGSNENSTAYLVVQTCNLYS